MMPAISPGAAPAAGPLTAEEQDYLDRLIVRHRGRPGMLLNILEEIQENQPKKFLPLEYLDYLSSRTGIPGSQIYSVATFYALFNLKPQGRHTVCICRGTACHTRGSKALLERLRLLLGLSPGEDEGSADKLTMTTPDGEFTIRTVACFGQCALAPVVEVDHLILGHVNERTLEREVEAVRKGGRA
ncbi:MAG: NAD(P)H-dependent oxidoreductase subunit E [Bryobacteraceae bacterium]|nr:NAD(P)H-dependent oxidoreductase subunit E [Bryobacteraceae bacterium]MCX7602672.1 NAD(P)H-dependent oxidoreductase subunit E [Bryobacteraceae bacterium]